MSRHLPNRPMASTRDDCSAAEPYLRRVPPDTRRQGHTHTVFIFFCYDFKARNQASFNVFHLYFQGFLHPKPERFSRKRRNKGFPHRRFARPPGCVFQEYGSRQSNRTQHTDANKTDKPLLDGPRHQPTLRRRRGTKNRNLRSSVATILGPEYKPSGVAPEQPKGDKKKNSVGR